MVADSSGGSRTRTRRASRSCSRRRSSWQPGVVKLPDLFGTLGNGIRGQVIVGSICAGIAAYFVRSLPDEATSRPEDAEAVRDVLPGGGRGLHGRVYCDRSHVLVAPHEAARESSGSSWISTPARPPDPWATAGASTLPRGHLVAALVPPPGGASRCSCGTGWPWPRSSSRCSPPAPPLDDLSSLGLCCGRAIPSGRGPFRPIL